MSVSMDTASGSSRDHRAVEGLLRRRLRQGRSSTELRRLLARVPGKPLNIHLLTDEDIVRILDRKTLARRIQPPLDRWWAGDRHRAGSASDAKSTDRAKSTGTGGKAVKSSAEPATDRRDRATRPGSNPADRPFPPASQQAPEPKNWIEFHLLDDETDRPIANVPFRLSLPDGSVAEHASDGDGLIRLTDLPPGFCDIQAILDRGALEVVRIA